MLLELDRSAGAGAGAARVDFWLSPKSAPSGSALSFSEFALLTRACIKHQSHIFRAIARQTYPSSRGRRLTRCRFSSWLRRLSSVGSRRHGILFWICRRYAVCAGRSGRVSERCGRTRSLRLLLHWWRCLFLDREAVLGSIKERVVACFIESVHRAGSRQARSALEVSDGAYALPFKETYSFAAERATSSRSSSSESKRQNARADLSSPSVSAKSSSMAPLILDLSAGRMRDKCTWKHVPLLLSMTCSVDDSCPKVAVSNCAWLMHAKAAPWESPLAPE